MLSTHRIVVVSSVPRFPRLQIPLYLWATRIMICDTSILDGYSQTIAVNRFRLWLKRRGFAKKTEISDLYAQDLLRWQANVLAARLLQKRYAAYRKKKHTLRYFCGYLAHRQISPVARTIFFRKLSRDLKKRESTSVLVDCVLADHFLFRNVSLLLAVLGSPLLFLVQLLVVSRLVLQKTRPTFALQKRQQGGVAVDLIFGLTLDQQGQPLPGRYSDSFLVGRQGSFSLQQHAFLDFGWQKNEFFTLRREIEDAGARVFGIRSFKPRIPATVLLRLIFDSMICWKNLSFAGAAFLRLSSQWLLVKFCAERLLAQLCFVQVRPSVYFSRMDYSYRHHAVGAACHDAGIHFAGICHSPLGGTGYTPQSSLLSFDTYFIYTPIFAKKFFPTWRNNFTQLVPVGVWRSDFIDAVQRQRDYASDRERLGQILGNRFVVALHLPVPQAYMFDRKTVMAWMRGFADLVANQTDVAFILFPRRLHQAPDYFHQQLADLLIPGRCELAESLKPDWKQAYSWVPVCDMVIGCLFSDAVLEALACGIPAVSYGNTGQGQAQLEKFDRSFSVYDADTLALRVEQVRKKLWPTSEQWQNIAQHLAWKADGHCVDRIKKHLTPFIETRKILRN